MAHCWGTTKGMNRLWGNNRKLSKRVALLKTHSIAISIIILFLTVSIVHAEGITLFDYQGEATAYIDTDHGMNIYVWDGKPVAYIEGSSIWGFNGTHLGWFKEGIIWDHDGYAVGFSEGSVGIVTKVEPEKGIRQIAPIKSIKGIKPIKPMHKEMRSRVPLSLFFFIRK